MKLLIIRHAIAMDREDYQNLARRLTPTAEHEASDDFRPLTDEGSRKMKRNAKGLSRLVDKPDLVVTSPLTRAMQTAEILRNAWGETDIASCDELRPGHQPQEFTKWLSTQPQARKRDSLVIAVGHEPHLSTLMSWLLSGTAKSFIDFKKGGACLMEFRAGVGFEKSRGKLLWLATPAMLRLV